jgi:hypothetical protein
MTEPLIADERIRGVNWLPGNERRGFLGNVGFEVDAADSEEVLGAGRLAGSPAVQRLVFIAEAADSLADKVGFGVRSLDNLLELLKASLRDRHPHSFACLALGHAGGGVDNPTPHVVESAAAGVD